MANDTNSSEEIDLSTLSDQQLQEYLDFIEILIKTIEEPIYGEPMSAMLWDSMRQWTHTKHKILKEIERRFLLS